MSTILRPVVAAGLWLRAEEAARRWAGQAPPMGPAGAMKADALEAMHCKADEEWGKHRQHPHTNTHPRYRNPATTAAEKIESQPASCLKKLLCTRARLPPPYSDRNRVGQPGFRP